MIARVPESPPPEDELDQAFEPLRLEAAAVTFDEGLSRRVEGLLLARQQREGRRRDRVLPAWAAVAAAVLLALGIGSSPHRSSRGVAVGGARPAPTHPLPPPPRSEEDPSPSAGGAEASPGEPSR